MNDRTNYDARAELAHQHAATMAAEYDLTYEEVVALLNS